MAQKVPDLKSSMEESLTMVIARIIAVFFFLFLGNFFGFYGKKNNKSYHRDSVNSFPLILSGTNYTWLGVRYAPHSVQCLVFDDQPMRYSTVTFKIIHI